MDRHYLINNKPKLVSLFELINSMAKDGEFECSQLQIERIIKLDVDKITHVESDEIKRVR